MDEFKHAVQQLQQLTWDAIEARQDKVTGQKVLIPETEFLEKEQIESRFSDNFPVLAHLDRAIELASNYELADIASRFSEIVEGFRWSQNPSYNKDNCKPDLLNGYAYAAFSGPDAPILCSVPRGGLMIMAPHVTYPAHEHGPKEVYLVLTPGAQWQLNGGEWFDVKPGDLILHESWVVHAMRTTNEPLLAFSGWLESGVRQQIGWSEGQTD